MGVAASAPATVNSRNASAAAAAAAAPAPAAVGGRRMKTRRNRKKRAKSKKNTRHSGGGGCFGGLCGNNKAVNVMSQNIKNPLGLTPQQKMIIELNTAKTQCQRRRAQLIKNVATFQRLAEELKESNPLKSEENAKKALQVQKDVEMETEKLANIESDMNRLKS